MVAAQHEGCLNHVRESSHLLLAKHVLDQGPGCTQFTRDRPVPVIGSVFPGIGIGLELELADHGELDSIGIRSRLALRNWNSNWIWIPLGGLI